MLSRLVWSWLEAVKMATPAEKADKLRLVGNALYKKGEFLKGSHSTFSGV